MPTGVLIVLFRVQDVLVLKCVLVEECLCCVCVVIVAVTIVVNINGVRLQEEDNAFLIQIINHSTEFIAGTKNRFRLNTAIHLVVQAAIQCTDIVNNQIIDAFCLQLLYDGNNIVISSQSSNNRLLNTKNILFNADRTNQIQNQILLVSQCSLVLQLISLLQMLSVLLCHTNIAGIITIQEIIAHSKILIINQIVGSCHNVGGLTRKDTAISLLISMVDHIGGSIDHIIGADLTAGTCNNAGACFAGNDHAQETAVCIAILAFPLGSKDRQTNLFLHRFSCSLGQVDVLTINAIIIENNIVIVLAVVEINQRTGTIGNQQLTVSTLVCSTKVRQQLNISNMIRFRIYALDFVGQDFGLECAIHNAVLHRNNHICNGEFKNDLDTISLTLVILQDNGLFHASQSEAVLVAGPVTGNGQGLFSVNEVHIELRAQ